MDYKPVIAAFLALCLILFAAFSFMFYSKTHNSYEESFEVESIIDEEKEVSR